MTTFTPGNDCVWMETATGKIRLSRERVARKLESYQQHHDELLRSGRTDDRLAARRIRTLSLDLDFAQPSEWHDCAPIPALLPITTQVRKLDPAMWPQFVDGGV